MFFFLFQSFFAERFFAIFDTNGRSDIECGELIDGLRMLKFGTPTQKLKFLFDVFDVDGNVYIILFKRINMQFVFVLSFLCNEAIREHNCFVACRMFMLAIAL